MSTDETELGVALTEPLATLGAEIVDAPLHLKTLKPTALSSELLNQGDYVGRLEAKETGEVGWVIFSQSSAIAIAGLLLERPKPSIEENIENGKLVGDDSDAIAEFANQFISPINDIIASRTDATLHFVLKDSGSDGSLAPEFEGLVAFCGALNPQELAAGTLTVLLPADPLGFGVNKAGENAAAASEGQSDAEAGHSADSEDGADGSAQPASSGDDDSKPRSAAAAQSTDEALALTPEELAAIREATTQMTGGTKALFVIPVQRERERWKTTLDDAKLECSMAASLADVPRALRSGEFGVVVIDADTCPARGLDALAKVRSARVRELVVAVLVSSPTKTHLISCLAAGTQHYLRKPIETPNLIASLGLSTTAAA